MKRTHKMHKDRKAKPISAPEREPVPIQAAELAVPYRAYTPEPVPVESAKPWGPWYRFGM